MFVEDPQGRVWQAFLNIQAIARSEGASLQDCVRLTIDVSHLARLAPMVEKARAEPWIGPPFPPRTMVEVRRLFDDDIVEIDSVLYAPRKKWCRRSASTLGDAVDLDQRIAHQVGDADAGADLPRVRGEEACMDLSIDGAAR